MNMPPRVADHYQYWATPPPERSARCAAWEARIANGWKPNKRFRAEGYDTASQMFGVYIWEYQNVLYPLLYPKEDHAQVSD